MIVQTYTNWELILVDDGSTDGTREHIQLFHDQRIHVLSLPHCGNIAALRNAGVTVSAGEWVAFLDSDDIWIPEKLDLQLQILLQQGRSWSYGGSELMNEKAKTIPFNTGYHTPMSGWITEELLTNKVSALIGSLMLQRKLFEELGGFDSNPGLLFREDYELALRLSLKAATAAFTGLLVRVREHPGRSTNGIDDGHERTAFVYGYFAKYCPDSKLKKIARRRQAYHITETAVKTLQKRRYLRAFLQLGVACWKRDKLRHVFSALRRINPQKK